MCGIIGYTGSRTAAPILLDGLKRLEYRGYDSAGIAVNDNGRINLEKTTGKVENLIEKGLFLSDQNNTESKNGSWFLSICKGNQRLPN